MPGSPRKKRGESPQSGAKPGATLRWCSGRAAERVLRTFVRLERMRRWRDELAAAEDGERFRHGMGRRPSLRRNDGQKQGEKQVPLYARDDRKGSARSSIGRDTQPLQASSLCESGLKA